MVVSHGYDAHLRKTLVLLFVVCQILFVSIFRVRHSTYLQRRYLSFFHFNMLKQNVSDTVGILMSIQQEVNDKINKGYHGMIAVHVYNAKTVHLFVIHHINIRDDNETTQRPLTSSYQQNTTRSCKSSYIQLYFFTLDACLKRF